MGIETESRPISATNIVIAIKESVPGSNSHLRAISSLADLLTKDPSKIAVLSKLQKDK